MSDEVEYNLRRDIANRELASPDKPETPQEKLERVRDEITALLTREQCVLLSEDEGQTMALYLDDDSDNFEALNVGDEIPAPIIKTLTTAQLDPA